MNLHRLSVTAALLLASAATGALAQTAVPSANPANPPAAAASALPAKPGASAVSKPAAKTNTKQTAAAAAAATAAAPTTATMATTKPGIVVTDAPLAPAQPRPLPVQRTVPDSREAATMPNELRPQQPATSQINIPLGRTPPAPSHTTANPSGINDAAGRCMAIADATERALCREREGAPVPKPKK